MEKLSFHSNGGDLLLLTQDQMNPRQWPDIHNLVFGFEQTLNIHNYH